MKMLKNLTLVALLVPGTVFAENAATVLELPKIDAVSTTPVMGLATPLNQVPGNVQSISAKTIDDQHIVDFTEALNSNLGSVTLNDTQSSPMQMDVSFRGFTASPILGTPQGLSVFVDGVRVNEAFGDVVNWDLIPKNAISSITVMPGSNPVFGLNTLGGAISVNTKSGFDFPGTTITASDGRWNRRTLNFETGGHGENMDYFLATSFMDDNGWGAHNPAIVRQLFAKVGWQNDRTDVDFSVQLADNHFNGNQSVPLQMMGNPSMPYTWPDFESNRINGYNLKGTQFLTDNWLLAGNLYSRQVITSVFNSNVSNNVYDSVQNPNPGGCNNYNTVDSNYPAFGGAATDSACNVLSSVNQLRTGGALQVTSTTPIWDHQNTLTLGIAYDHGTSNFQEGLQSAVVAADRSTYSSQPISPYVSIVGYTNTQSFYATNTLGVTDKTYLTLSGRYDRTAVKVDDQFGSQLDQNNSFNRFNPAAGMTYNPTSTLTTYVNYSQGMRAPTPVELACASPTDPCALPNAFNSDPALKPVTSSSWEMGARGQIAKTFKWNAAVFNTILNNDIQFLPAPSSTTSGYFSNVGQTQRRGLEMGLSGDYGKVRWLTNYTFMDARFQSSFAEAGSTNTSQNAVQPGNRIPGIPQHTFKIRLEYLPIESVKVGLSMLAQSNQYPRGDENNQDAMGALPGFAVFNLDARYRFNNSWELFGKVDNLFNRTYSTFGQLGSNLFAGGAYNPGNPIATQFRTVAAPIGAWVGVTWRFGGEGKKSAVQDND